MRLVVLCAGSAFFFACGGAPPASDPEPRSGAGGARDEGSADVVTGASRQACGTLRMQCADGWICARATDGGREVGPLCAAPRACEGECASGECVRLLEPERSVCVVDRVCPIPGHVYASGACEDHRARAPGCYAPCDGEGAACDEGRCVAVRAGVECVERFVCLP